MTEWADGVFSVAVKLVFPQRWTWAQCGLEFMHIGFLRLLVEEHNAATVTPTVAAANTATYLILKLSLWRSKWPHPPPLLWLALPQAPYLIRGPLYHQRGPIVRDLHGLNSHGGIIETAPINKAGDTRMQSHQPAEIIQIGLTLVVIKALYVTQCMHTVGSLTHIHTTKYKKIHCTLHPMWSTHPLSFAHWCNSNLTVFLKN